MLKTVKIGRWFGIDTYIHWSFWLLMVFILLSESMAGGWRHGVAASAFLGFVFLCVYLHEIGHALAARGYGIRTHDITLLPFGGMARLESLPTQPHQELVVAIAGPIVNVVIAASLGTVLFLSDGLQQNLQDNPCDWDGFSNCFGSTSRSPFSIYFQPFPWMEDVSYAPCFRIESRICEPHRSPLEWGDISP